MCVLVHGLRLRSTTRFSRVCAGDQGTQVSRSNGASKLSAPHQRRHVCYFSPPLPPLCVPLCGWAAPHGGWLGTRYLAKLSDWRKMELGEYDPNAKGKNVTKLVAGVSPFLEAFGNAKTNMNDNSSRFGRWFRSCWTLE